MLATKILKRREKKNWFYRKTEPFFAGMNHYYYKSLDAFLHHRYIALPIVLIMLGIIAYLWIQIPSEMAPLEDRSRITINTRGPEGVTYEYMRDYTEDINLLADSIVPDATAITARVSSGTGSGLLNLRSTSAIWKTGFSYTFVMNVGNTSCNFSMLGA